MKTIISFFKRNDGPTTIEYAVFIALIVVACLIAVNMIGGSTNTIFEETTGSLSEIDATGDSGDDDAGDGSNGSAGDSGDSGDSGNSDSGNSGKGNSGKSSGKSGSAPGRNK